MNDDAEQQAAELLRAELAALLTSDANLVQQLAQHFGAALAASDTIPQHPGVAG